MASEFSLSPVLTERGCTFKLNNQCRRRSQAKHVTRGGGPTEWCEMSEYKRSRSLAVCLCTVITLTGVSPTSTAWGDGNNQLLIGGAYFSPRERSDPTYTELQDSALGAVLGIDPTFTSPGTKAHVSESQTILLAYARAFTDHFTVKLEGGIPPKFELKGEGVVQPTGPSGNVIQVDLGAPENNPLASARLWAPTVLFQYVFRDPSRAFRPSVALGTTYTFYTDEELDPDFRDALNQQFGRTLALATGNPAETSVSAEAEGGFGYIANVGFDWRFSERWSVIGSVSFLRLAETSTIAIHAANGERLATSKVHIDVDPVISALLLGYRF